MASTRPTTASYATSSSNPSIISSHPAPSPDKYGGTSSMRLGPMPPVLEGIPSLHGGLHGETVGAGRRGRGGLRLRLGSLGAVEGAECKMLSQCRVPSNPSARTSPPSGFRQERVRLVVSFVSNPCCSLSWGAVIHAYCTTSLARSCKKNHPS